MGKRKEYSKFDSAYMFFASIVFVQAIVLFVFIIYGIIAKQMGIELETFTGITIVKYVNTVLIQCIFLGIFFIYNKRKKIDFVEATKLNKSLNIKSVLLMIVIALVCLFGLTPLINMFDHILGLIGVNLSTELAIPLSNFWQFLLGVLFMAVLPAIAEEFVFRGIVFNGLLKNTTPKKAIILSAVIFCIMHLSIQQTVYQFVLGIVLALVVYYTGSLLASIFVHFINNFVVILFNYISQSAVAEEVVYINFWSYFVPILIAGIVTIALILLFRTLKNVNIKNKVESQRENYVVEKQDGFTDIIKNPDFIMIATFIIALLFWTTSFFS